MVPTPLRAGTRQLLQARRIRSRSLKGQTPAPSCTETARSL